MGSGKSSLLSAVIGEMVTISGKVLQHRSAFEELLSLFHSAHTSNCFTHFRSLRVAYVAQRAWLMNATLRDNVLFGSVFDAEKYEEVVQKSALMPDIEILIAGDQTEIGEKV